MTTPRTQDLPTSAPIHGEFDLSLFNDLMRSVKPEHRRDRAALRYVVSPGTAQKFRAAHHDCTEMRFGFTPVHVDETLGDDVILLERAA